MIGNDLNQTSMQSTTATTSASNSNGSNLTVNGAMIPVKQPSHLTIAAIKKLSDPLCAKHHSKLDYVLQIVRVKDLSKPVGRAQDAKGGTEADDKKAKSQMKCK